MFSNSTKKKLPNDTLERLKFLFSMHFKLVKLKTIENANLCCLPSEFLGEQLGGGGAGGNSSSFRCLDLDLDLDLDFEDDDVPPSSDLDGSLSLFLFE